MRNAGLEETQAGMKIAGRNINNLSYADDTTLMAESEEELKSLCYSTLQPHGRQPTSLPGSSVYGIFQARVLEWVAISFSQGSSRSSNRTRISCIAGRFFYHLSHRGGRRVQNTGNK